MRIDKINLTEDMKNEIVQKLNAAEDKGQAITEAVEMIIAESQKGLIDQTVTIPVFLIVMRFWQSNCLLYETS